jgi:membrane-bound lytic murein transglycosylase MltF
MSSLRLKAGRAIQLLTAACVLLAQMAFAQVVPAPPQDLFAALQANLIGAADRALADALADRPWMKAASSDADVERQTTVDDVQRLGAAVQRVQQLRPLVEPILRAEGAPPELIAVALVESGGQATALSPKGARGVWQFMPATARRYGLVVSARRDERLDITKSTRAAARYLRDLYQRFGDWQLAFAAYNAGEKAVEHAGARTGQRDFSSIQRVLPQETRNYVPAVLNAMAKLGTNPEGVLRAVNSSRSPTARLLYASAEATE